MTVIDLTEYASVTLPPDAFSEADALRLWPRFAPQVQVEFPSPKTAGQWRLTAQGWVGSIPLRPGLTLRLWPRVPLAGLLRMWEIAYDLAPLQLLDGLITAESLDEVTDLLARMLAQRVLARARRGLQHAYLPDTADLPVVRGRLDTAVLARRPPGERFPCRYSRFTADIPDNQIPAYTLGLIARGNHVSGPARAAVRRAYRTLHGVVTPRPFSAADCAGRSYTRLTDDYRAIHALCRFFLEHTQPGYRDGEREMIPFLIDMARLYERFVAAWLGNHLPPGWRLRAQDSVRVGPADDLRFRIDLTLFDPDGRVFAVLDTKYKPADRPAPADVSQVVAYAKARRCRTAVLVYPAPLSRPLDAHLDDLHIRTLTFDCGRDPHDAGRHFLSQLTTHQQQTIDN